jgi:hypothetical protein
LRALLPGREAWRVKMVAVVEVRRDRAERRRVVGCILSMVEL